MHALTTFICRYSSTVRVLYWCWCCRWLLKIIKVTALLWAVTVSGDRAKSENDKRWMSMRARGIADTMHRAQCSNMKLQARRNQHVMRRARRWMITYLPAVPTSLHHHHHRRRRRLGVHIPVTVTNQRTLHTVLQHRANRLSEAEQNANSWVVCCIYLCIITDTHNRILIKLHLTSYYRRFKVTCVYVKLHCNL